MRPKNMTEFDIAMQDLKEIFYLIEKIWATCNVTPKISTSKIDKLIQVLCVFL